MNQPANEEAVAVPQKGRARPRIAAICLTMIRRHGADLLVGAASAGYLLWILLWLYSEFARGAFSFHDLTLITDLATNALYHGKPFWITDYAINHLKIHFTPTLLLLVPGFLFFKTQFALIAIVAGTVALAVFIATREQLASLGRAQVPVFYRAALAAAFFVLIAVNRYTLRCLWSAHFEPLYILMAVLVLAAVRRGSSLRVLLPACLLAVGVRQDAGLFLSLMLASCLLAPQSWPQIRRDRVLLAAVGCGAYLLLVTKLILPYFGSDVGTRFWRHWGATWPEVFAAWAAQPQRVYKAIGSSEFFMFNGQFCYLQVLHGAAWLLNQLPSILFYTADAWDKRTLAYYNASFLLPGMFLCLSFSQLCAVAFIQRLARTSLLLRHAGHTLLTCAFVAAAINVALLSEPDNEHVLVVGEYEREDIFTNWQIRHLLRCPKVRSVAADFRNIVYVPLKFDRYLLRNARKADLVVQHHKDDHLPMSIPPKRMRTELTKDAGYTLLPRVDGYDVYLAPGVQCF